MSGQSTTPEDLSQEDIDLNFIRTKRVDIVHALSDEKTGKVPTDPETLSLFMANLKDWSRDALTRKRIKSDEKIAQGNTATLQLAAQILSTVRIVQPALPSSTQVIEIGRELPTPELIPGELDKEGKGENFKSFTGRMQQ